MEREKLYHDANGEAEKQKPCKARVQKHGEVADQSVVVMKSL
jgi:hypothetical protein